jgi:acetyl-CoA carboxylase carboxyltransferase component
VPERQRRAYNVAPIIETLADEGSVTFLRERFAPEMVTALARIEGRPVGVIANNTMHMAGAITATRPTRRRASCSSATRSGCRSSRSSTRPGMMVGPRPRRPALVRHTSRLLVAGARCACRSSR